MLKKNTLREIRNSLGRYIAILAIVALGVGFFSGLKVTREAMVTTADGYLASQNFYDYRLLSSLGFDEENVKAMAEEDSVQTAEGAISKDILFTKEDEAEQVIMFHSLTENINDLTLVSGKMPSADNECVVDHKYFSEEDIGKTITLSQSNSDDDLDMFKYKEYTITGIAVSPYYLNFERGSTALGNGSISGFAYIPQDGFDTDYYTEIFLTLKESYTIYSDEYEALIDKTEKSIETAAEAQSQARYEKIVKEAEDELADGQKEYDENYDKYLSEKADAESQLADSYKQIVDGQAALDSKSNELDSQEKTLKASLAKAQSGLSEVAESRRQLELAEASGQLSDEEIAQTRQTLDATEKELNTNITQIQAGLAAIEDGRTQIEKNKNTLAESLVEYNEAKKEAEEGFAEAEKELADAEKELSDARAEIDDINPPDTYVLDRSTNVGYACFESDSNIVNGIARVFPIFFFLVAALVCMTTMTRMVDDQRTQIGVLKALGYSNGSVIGKYLFYAGSASGLGCIIGFMAGCYIFPTVIWKAYMMMYDFSADLTFIFNTPLAIISLAVSLLCSMGATVLSCYNEFREVPAQLIRPKSPKEGKRILLERIPFIWKRLSFLYKVSFRNIFRYKKRFLMMVLGISGCTALLLTGLGVRDSIKNVVDYQYDEIQVYDYSVTFDREMTDARQKTFLEDAKDYVEDLLFISEGSCDLVNGKSVKSVNMIAASSESRDSFSQFIDLHDADGNKIAYPSKGEVVICRKLAEDYNLSAGDEVLLRNEDMKEMRLTVSAICENYVYNYVYVTPESCEESWGTLPEVKTALVNVTSEEDSDAEAAYTSSGKILGLSHVAAVSINNDLRLRVDNMMKSLDYVIALVILSAGALAFIVLYNLTNINITERIREIATIKVLGFYPGETSSYVFRENIFLTGISAVVGLALGKWLHAFVMSQIKIDMMYFDIRVAPVSYVLAVVLTFVFAIIVNLAMYYKLDKISMTESLKSTE